MVHQLSTWELSLHRAKQQFRDHQHEFQYNDGRIRISSKLPNSMQTDSEMRTTTNSDYKQNICYNSKSPFDSWFESITEAVDPHEKHTPCVPSNLGMQVFDYAQKPDSFSSKVSSAFNAKDPFTATSGRVFNENYGGTMIQYLAKTTERQIGFNKSLADNHYTRSPSMSSGPSLSSLFASATSTTSTTSTDITTPVLDGNHFQIPSWDKAMQPMPLIDTSNGLHRYESLAKTPQDVLVLNKYPVHQDVNEKASEFIPSAILKGESRPTNPEMIRKAAEVGLPSNPNYKGEFTNFNLRNAMCLDHENCSVRIHKIPPEANHSEIFALITHGKVFSFNYTPPVKGLFTHAAADLVFLTREAAQDFFHDAKLGRGLYIRGERLMVMWNRIKVMPAEGRYERMSRVVRIKGPATELSAKIVEEFFRGRFEFDLVTNKEWIQRDGWRIVELAFSSIRSQSESAVKSFNIYVEQRMPNAGYRIWYAPDPCFKLDRIGNFRLSGN
ncbi:uncharacterized protein Bfra_011457 [Botrytis fragariae]|uniref:Uncharacterized protein n=1 Tax=Botrytis fragariae TaxID=1964551 RepID=A0A8H6AXR3_9HELO|nr:uncharacterized protein Bfra_011457 [Botrytis fragariae]KAF5875694.1 hypothetical protein Bfra_011457 [Botrytis fragariae]